MTHFTDNPFERLMKQRPRQRLEKLSPVLLKSHPCYGCSYLQGSCCTGVCYRELIIPKKQRKVDK
jgi:hypothetical protein